MEQPYLRARVWTMHDSPWTLRFQLSPGDVPELAHIQFTWPVLAEPSISLATMDAARHVTAL